MGTAVMRPDGSPWDLSVATRKEEALWLLERLVPGNCANNLATAFQFDGTLEISALQNALAALFCRHEVLRTVYFAMGSELLKGVTRPEDFSIEIVEFNDPDLSQNYDELMQAFVDRRFAFDGGPLVRAGLFHTPDGTTFCLIFHHLVYDIISGRRVLEDLVTAYRAIVAGRPLPKELLVAVPAFHEPEPTAASLEYWRKQLDGFDPDQLKLNCGAQDLPEPTLAGDAITHVLSSEATDSVRRLPREVRAPESVVLLAAFNLLLASHGAGPDITVGSPVNVRPRGNPDIIGHHTNVLPLRVHVDPTKSFRSLARRVRDTYFNALAHADVSVDVLTEVVPRAGASWHDRLCRHLFNYYPQKESAEFQVSSRSVRPVVVENGYSKFDLELFITPTPEGVEVTARYSTQKFDKSDVRALLRRYDALLVAAAADTDRPIAELRAWNGEDTRVIESANATTRDSEPMSVLEAVHSHASRSPEAVAIRHGERSVNYLQLWQAAVATRNLLVESGVTRGDFVAVAVSRSPELTASVLGVWLARAAYLPVDTEHPAERVRYILTDSGATAMLTDDDRIGAADHDVRRLMVPAVPQQDLSTPFTQLPLKSDPDSCAYLIYTSGSTGRPKGTLIPHRAISNIAADYTERLHASPADTTLWMTTFAFDMANLEHYIPLYSGGQIAVAPDEARTDGQVLRELIKHYQPGILQATPTTWRLVLHDVADVLRDRRVVIGAEPVPEQLAKNLVSAGCEVHHAYGPTETTTWCTWGVLPTIVQQKLDIGAPIGNTRVMVLGRDGYELPIGVRGEICIAGDGVSLGYHAAPELNTERFGEHAEHGRYYRSGDLGQWRQDGTLELFGRADRKVKLRGNRIELGEIEAIVAGHPRVDAAAAVVVGDRSGDGRLVVFVETDLDDPEVASELWEHARSRLPSSAIPQGFVSLDSLPVNTNEKIDYPALEHVAESRHSGEQAISSADSDNDDSLEQALVDLWKRFLDDPGVSPHSNFFTQGGHSLLGAQLLQTLEGVHGITVKLADLFAAPTPDSLAQRIKEMHPE